MPVDIELAHLVASIQQTLTQEQKLRFIDLLDKLAPERHLGAFVKLDYTSVVKGR